MHASRVLLSLAVLTPSWMGGPSITTEALQSLETAEVLDDEALLAAAQEALAVAVDAREAGDLGPA